MKAESLNCMFYFLLCVSGAAHKFRCPWKAEEGIGPPGAGVPGSFELLWLKPSRSAVDTLNY